MFLARHPRGLPVLFGTEVWERFSFYGINSILLLYLTKSLLFPDAYSNQLVGIFGSLVYLCPVIGGYVADRLLGYRKSIMWGAVLMALGSFLLVIQGQGAQVIADGDASRIVRDPLAIQSFFAGIAAISVGTGLFKANISSLLGRLYADDIESRDSGFSIFYLGINIGATLGPVVVGLLAEKVDWRFGFLAAAIGMLLALWLLHLGRKHLEGRGEPPHPELLRRRFAGLTVEYWTYIGTLLAIGGIWMLIRVAGAIDVLLYAAAAAGVGYVLYLAFFKSGPEARGRALVALVLIAGSVFFWALYFQQFFALTLFTDRLVDRVVFGFEIPASNITSLSAAFVILLSAPFAWLWGYLSSRGIEPSTPYKFSCALLIIGGAFLLLYGAAAFAESGILIPLGWLVFYYFLIVVGEMFLSPIGLSMITKLALPQATGLMMGLWFLAISFALNIGGKLAGRASIANVEEAMQSGTIYSAYGDLWLLCAGLGLVPGLILLALSRPLYRHMHGMH